jgi:drug/metabolite transporter (DMT)-like permease
MGALAVVVTGEDAIANIARILLTRLPAILSRFVLKERLSFIGWIACFLCIVGSIMIALYVMQVHMDLKGQG